MPQAAALEALLLAYRDEIGWLFAKAKDHEGEKAAEYVHRARNLQAIVDGYERLHAKNT